MWEGEGEGLNERSIREGREDKEVMEGKRWYTDKKEAGRGGNI